MSVPSVPAQEAIGNSKRLLGNAAKHWVFTWNSYPDNAQTLLQELTTRGTKVLCFSSEIGESGNKHIQGYIELYTKQRWSGLGLPAGIHWEVARDHIRARDYAIKKDHTFDSEANIFFTYGFRPSRTRDLQLITFDQMYPWQREIVKLLDMPLEKRHIYWYYDEVGCTGKTSIIRYMGTHFADRVVWSAATKSADIMTLADENADMYLFNFTRSQAEFAPYQALESLKDGLISDGKLKKKVRQYIGVHAHIVCFANWPPDLTKLSLDRWIVKNIEPSVVRPAGSWMPACSASQNTTGVLQLADNVYLGNPQLEDDL